MAYEIVYRLFKCHKTFFKNNNDTSLYLVKIIPNSFEESI